jgi:uncharacterized membrane protein
VDAYTLLKFVHVLSAIVAVGFNASYGLWLGRAGNDDRVLPYALSTLRVVDNVANAFYGLLLVTGLAMVFVGGLDLRVFWIAAALALYVLAVLVGIVLYRPVLARQRAALASGGAASAEFQRTSRQGRTLGIATAVIVLVIVFLMVTKPTPFTL